MKIHFHKWKKFWDVYFYPTPTYEVKRIYRHCSNCGKWQRKYVEQEGDVYWNNSNIPDRYDSLMIEKEAREKIKLVNMEKEAL